MENLKVLGFIDPMRFEPSVSRGAKQFLKNLRLDEEERQAREEEEEYNQIMLANYKRQFDYYDDEGNFIYD